MTDSKMQMKIYTNLIDSALDRFYPEIQEEQKTISNASRYSLLAGGKRIRPVLCLATGSLFGTSAETLLPYACAIEMIHAFSLIHDDLPGMDNDDYRRGKLTNHKVFGEGIAILAGDALINKAYEIMIADCISYPANGKLEAMFAICKATGDQGMIGGQVIDLESEHKLISKELLKKLHSMKTGALIKAPVIAACRIGQAGADESRILESYADYIGLAFQIKDDILDVTSDSQKMGKTTGKDSASEKSTYVSLYGLEKSQEFLTDTIDRAFQSLNEMKILGYEIGFLNDLTDFLFKREN
ncbi:MAG: polyprenyl synthetase family protein [Saccharofermentanales bacterium]